MQKHHPIQQNRNTFFFSVAVCVDAGIRIRCWMANSEKGWNFIVTRKANFVLCLLEKWSTGMYFKPFKDPCLLNFHSINAFCERARFQRIEIAFRERFIAFESIGEVCRIENIDLIKTEEALLKVSNFKISFKRYEMCCIKGVSKISYLLWRRFVAMLDTGPTSWRKLRG